MTQCYFTAPLTRHECRADAAFGRERVVNDPAKPQSPKPQVPSPKPQAPSPKPQAPSPKPQAPSPKPQEREMNLTLRLRCLQAAGEQHAVNLGDAQPKLAQGRDIRQIGAGEGLLGREQLQVTEFVLLIAGPRQFQ